MVTHLIIALIAAASAAINVPAAMGGDPISMGLVVFISAAIGANLALVVMQRIRG